MLVPRLDRRTIPRADTFTPLQNYVDAVNAIRIKLQNRLDHPLSAEEREGKPALRRFDIPPSQYRVVATTDEEPGSELWGELDKLGWKVINHVRTTFLIRAAAQHSSWN